MISGSPGLLLLGASNPIAESTELRNRRRVSSIASTSSIVSTLGGLLLALGACIAQPVALVRAAEDKPATTTEMKPTHEDAQTLFSTWQANARTDGKIPGALIGKLGAEVRYFISLNKDDESGHDYAVKFEALLARFDVTGDWTPPDTIALLDDIAAISSIPLNNALDAAAESIIHTGEPLPAELASAAWGQPAPDGLRVAWLLEPRAPEYPLGTSLKSRILLHNSGQKAVIFLVPSWQQSSSHTAHDAHGAALNVSSTYWTTMARKVLYRLAPGEYCETPAPGLGVGARTEDEDWANVRVGAWIDAKQGDEVRFAPGAVEVRCSPSVIGTRMMDGQPVNVDPKDAADLWGRIIAERVARELPLPTAAAERERIIRRVTLDLFGEPPTPEEVAAFVADEATTAQAAFEQRLRQRPGLAPFTGTLPPGEIQFRVLAAVPDAAKRPRVVTGPGYFILGDNERLHVERSSNGQRRSNKATIQFFSSNPKTNPPGKPYEIALPDGLSTYAIAWDRGAGKLWIAQDGLVRSCDFTHPAQVQETRFEPGNSDSVPEQFREVLKAALDVPGATAK